MRAGPCDPKPFLIDISLVIMIALALLVSALLSAPALAAPADKRDLLGLLTEKKLTFAKDGTFKVCGMRKERNHS